MLKSPLRIRRFHSSVVVAGALVALLYWFYLPSQGPSRSHDQPAPPAIVSGSLHIDGPYFSDQDRIADRIIAAINRTRDSLDIAVYSITQPDIAAAIEQAHARGVRIRVVSDEQQSGGYHSEVDFLRSHGIAVRLSGGFRGQRSYMHNKFAVFDDRVIETGSFNWTTSASSYNFENAIFIENPEVAARYEKEFQHLWAQAHE
jgi:phosphatidylserine/phosphatidylglycerophosphate/cardiolipin synthase-like enzyme